ncbi:MAG: acyl-CoA dehydrogenase family protein [Pseudomonadales bacterium]
MNNAELLDQMLANNAVVSSAADNALISSITAWRQRFPAVLESHSTIQAAFAGGFRSHWVSIAFACGYRAALQQLCPQLKAQQIVSFCVTEDEGNSSRAIQTRLTAVERGWSLDGKKSFVTGGRDATQLLVAARKGEHEDGRPAIVLILCEATAPGLTFEDLPHLPFVPEISHCRIKLQKVAVEAADILPGDGYTHYVKPFRTIEDMHVFAAVIGYLLRLSRDYQWPEESSEALLVQATTLLDLAKWPPDKAVTHLSLAGLIGQFNQWLSVSERHWHAVPAEISDAWRRDVPLLDIAEAARSKRRDNAWRFYSVGREAGKP